MAHFESLSHSIYNFEGGRFVRNCREVPFQQSTERFWFVRNCREVPFQQSTERFWGRVVRNCREVSFQQSTERFWSRFVRNCREVPFQQSTERFWGRFVRNCREVPFQQSTERFWSRFVRNCREVPFQQSTERFWSSPSPSALSQTVHRRCFWCGSSMLPTKVVQWWLFVDFALLNGQLNPFYTEWTLLPYILEESIFNLRGVRLCSLRYSCWKMAEQLAK